MIPSHLAVVWSLFQLSIASWLGAGHHLYPGHSFGLCHAGRFSQLPHVQETSVSDLKFLSATDRIPILDFAWPSIACFAALYIAIDLRPGLPSATASPTCATSSWAWC
jgi:TRAP-type uncharacterized transport system fused permease subunit